MFRALHRARAGRIVLLNVLVLAATFAVSSTPASGQAPGVLTGDMPPAGGVTLVAWSGGHVADVGPAAAAAGCDATSVWVTDAGTLRGYHFGAPAFVNSAFLGITNGGDLAADSLLVLVCRAGTVPVPAGPPALEAPRLDDYLLSTAEITRYRAAVNRCCPPPAGTSRPWMPSATRWTCRGCRRPWRWLRAWMPRTRCGHSTATPS
jgi:hypothetical protein